MVQKHLPPDKILGSLGKSCLGGKKLSGKIKWEYQSPGFYISTPFRFIVEKLDQSEKYIACWRVVDSRESAKYHAKTAKQVKDKAQEILDGEAKELG